MVIEALEKAYRSTRGAVERTVGGVMFDLGNRMALSGHERIAWPFIHYGATMKMYSSLPHTPLRFNPAILNPDGSLNIQTFSEGLRRGRSHPGEDDQAYYWTPKWQRDERAADRDIKAGRVLRFPSPREAIDFFKKQLPD